MRIDTNAAEAVAKVAGLANQIPEATKAGLRAVTDTLAKPQSEKQADKIESRPIPLGKRSRKPKWKRSGRNGGIAGSIASRVDRSSATVFVRGKAAVYATRGDRSRHELGESWTPANPADGVVRNNPFFKEAEETIAPQVQPVFLQGFANELKVK